VPSDRHRISQHAPIDITPTGFHVTIPDDMTKEDITKIILGVRDVLVNFVNARAVQKQLDK
jgi:hypothetical protein